MKFSLSTNWCNRRITSGRAISEKAMELGFEELELGFHTTAEQAAEIAAMRDRMPVGSIHAFCPVPMSAPQGYPELYLLASKDEGGRRLARAHVKKNLEFAASVGADAVVLHAGRVMCRGFIRRWDLKRRVKRGRRMIDVLKRELDALAPELEKNKVTLGLENLPYLEGFPAEWEMKDVAGDWVKPWFDTGHDFVRRVNRWPAEAGLPVPPLQPVGMHISDSRGGDDHLPPGAGRVDFATLKTMAENARHVVFEPAATVRERDLVAGIAHLRKLWSLG
ncbi:MAG: sugar phosphate isomerase/epimerase [Kiritimatiellae bacterium]|nr:sugar phosphate isomerase/epimerase [Kiritimatiellia bacterium]